jgi:hypothetical protein
MKSDKSALISQLFPIFYDIPWWMPTLTPRGLLAADAATGEVPQHSSMAKAAMDDVGH